LLDAIFTKGFILHDQLAGVLFLSKTAQKAAAAACSASPICVIYDAAGPGGALAVAAAVAAAGSFALLGRAGAAISSASAGSAGLAREAGPVVPAPAPGATDGAGSNAQRTR
jgi:hypothetical protein